ncbi:MAG: hypothetical protein EOO38_12865 [Cytophagaceae bacterium]|nr:MAG: hypothetical protein EOO38_12865 [Cytophagaceae bacterium]
MAERDFSEIGFTDVARRSFEALERLVELVKHTKKTVGWGSNDLVWSDNSTMVGVINDDGEVLYVPVEYLKWYFDLPKGTLKKLVAPVVTARHMVVASRDTEGRFRRVEVHQADVAIFMGEIAVEDEDYLFPELVHGEEMYLEGVITRGNQETNSMGFLFQNHILNCQPDTGSVRRFKRAMFLHCKVLATINRHVASHVQPDRRPTLIVHEVQILEADGQDSLFESS